MILSRRGVITGLISFAAAPAIVRIESLMPVKVILPIEIWPTWDGTRYYDVFTDFEKAFAELYRVTGMPLEYLK